MSGEGSPWIIRLGGAVTPRLRWLCFPHSGAGPSAFRPFVSAVPPWVELLAVQLPGREARRQEPPLRDLARIVEEIGQALPEGIPWAFMGHSLGGLLAFELIRWLRRSARMLPLALVASAARAPHLPYPHAPIADLPDAEARERLRAFSGTPAALLDDPEVMAMLLPPLKADMALVETYRHAPEPPIPVPILGLWGEEDHVVRREEVEGWGRHTSAHFESVAVPGAHFFLRTERDPVLDRVLSFMEAAELPLTPLRNARPRAHGARSGRP